MLEESKLAEKLKESFQDSTWDTKIHIIEALGWTQEREHIPFLLDLFLDPSDALSIAAASSILHILAP